MTTATSAPASAMALVMVMVSLVDSQPEPASTRRWLPAASLTARMTATLSSVDR